MLNMVDNYIFLSFVSTCAFAFAQLIAASCRQISFISHGKFLSFGGGTAISYVFIDLLPKLSESNSRVTQVLKGTIPYLEHHVYIMALMGFILFFIVDRIQRSSNENTQTFLLSLFSYAFFNFLIGYAVADPNNPEVQPLGLFTIALALHYFTNDYTLTEAHGEQYQKFGKWILIVSLFFGWMTGLLMTLSATAIALVSAFIGGGVIMNVTRHELPQENPNNLSSFLLGATLYTVIILMRPNSV